MNSNAAAVWWHKLRKRRLVQKSSGLISSSWARVVCIFTDISPCCYSYCTAIRSPNWVFTRSDRRTDRSVRLVCLTGRMKRLHVPIVGPTGRSDPGYVRLSVRPVGQTGRTDCSRTALICQSHQCGLLADYNTAYAAA